MVRDPRLLALSILLGLVACRDTQTSFEDDAGTSLSDSQPLTCTTMSDCGGMGICVGGVCEAVTPCTTEEECSGAGMVCHTTRGYCVECDGRHAGECASGFTCQFDFTCVPIGGADGGVQDGGNTCSGTCTDRTQCGAGLVCSSGSCCPPPPRCFGPQDCPSNRPECNGATGECFGGQDCFADADCNDEPGCEAGACFCDVPAPGNPGECRVRPDECQSDAQCAQDQVCVLNASPKRCLTAPACTTDADCASVGLVCDLETSSPSYHKCKNGQPCTQGGNQCNPSTQTCVSNVCVIKNCVNTPSLCQAGQVCEPSTGQCISNPLRPCPAGDGDCQSGYYCDTGLSPAECRLGCRDNNDCPGGVCNASHVCEGGQPAGLCGPCSTDADCPAGTACKEGVGGMLCYESCNSFLGQGCTLNPNAQCVLILCSCLGL